MLLKVTNYFSPLFGKEKKKVEEAEAVSGFVAFKVCAGF